MKFAAFAIAALIAINGALASSDAAPAVADTKVISAHEALETVKGFELPAGVTLTGAVDSIKEPAKKPEGAELASTHDKDDHKEWFNGWGLGGWGLGGWGGWGGWGGLGPYRFGFNCGGIGGWAYPLGYWNMYGVGLYGGGCGLGIPYGGLFYC